MPVITRFVLLFALLAMTMTVPQARPRKAVPNPAMDPCPSCVIDPPRSSSVVETGRV